MAKKNKVLHKMFISMGESCLIDFNPYIFKLTNSYSTAKFLNGQIVTYKNK